MMNNREYKDKVKRLAKTYKVVSWNNENCAKKIISFPKFNTLHKPWRVLMRIGGYFCNPLLIYSKLTENEVPK